MRPAWILVLAAFGCRGILGIERPIDLPDAAVDAAVDGAPASCAMWHPHGFDPCTLGAPMPALHLGAGQYTYDTTVDGGKLTDGAGQLIAQSRVIVVQPDSSAVAVLSVAALAVDAGAMIRVVGPRPLLVVSWSTVVVDGAIDAGSHLGVAALGANANIVCAGGAAGIDGADASTNGGSGGGGGGGLQGPGGHGGTGGAAHVAGGAGGAAIAIGDARASIHGGCPGGSSGAAGAVAVTPATPATQARGGAGGGALWLVAQESIAITGSITANGAGGSGALIHSVCGGGGGGSGGTVVLEAPAGTISGTMTANGGGGGGGGAAADTGAGNNGADGQSDVVAAPGGAIATGNCGRPGGAGSAQLTLAGADASGADACGGGGGGGAAGFIVIASAGFAATGTARISPPAIAP